MSGSKLLRLCSLFLCLLLCLANFSVVASAAEAENLVSSDLRDWYLGSDIDSSFIDPDNFIYNSTYNVSRLRVTFPYSESLGVYIGSSLIYDLPELKVGEKYQFSFQIPTVDVCQSISLWYTSDEVGAQYFGENTTCLIGIGYLDSNNEFTFYDGLFATLTYDNYTSFCGYTYKQSFELTNILGSPVFAVNFISSNENESILYLQDVSCVRLESESEKKLDGILGWLEELVTWVKELPGQVASKFSSFFASVEQNLDLNFDTLWETLEERLNVFDNFFTEIRNFFHDLYWDLVGGTCGYGDYHSSLFERLGDRISGFFDDLKLKIDVKVEEIKTSIHDFFVPPEGFFEEWKAKFDLMLSDNLGFIYQAPNFVIGIIEVVQEILQSDQEVNLVFPEVEFDIAGYHVELFKDTKVDFSFLEAGIWLTLYSMYKVMLYVIFALALIKYGMSTWERTMSN